MSLPHRQAKQRTSVSCQKPARPLAALTGLSLRAAAGRAAWRRGLALSCSFPLQPVLISEGCVVATQDGHGVGARAVVWCGVWRPGRTCLGVGPCGYGKVGLTRMHAIPAASGSRGAWDGGPCVTSPTVGLRSLSIVSLLCKWSVMVVPGWV